MDYISVTEYAKKYNLEPSGVRRALSQGRLSGQKVGSQWIIPSDAPLPTDARVKSGKYKNWRKKE